MDDVLVLETTVGSEADARVLADALVAERLAACAQILGPLESVYWWEGAVTAASEWLLRCKTTQGRSEALVARLRELHPYEVPELVVFEPIDVDGRYAAWVRDSVEGEGDGPDQGRLAPGDGRKLGQTSRD